MSVCQAALEEVQRNGNRRPGELSKLPVGYGANGMCTSRRYLPDDYSDGPQIRKSQHVSLGMGRVFDHSTSVPLGDVHKSMPKPERMKDMVRYKGPTPKTQVLKQANTNAELHSAVQKGDADLVAAIIKYGLLKKCLNVNAPLWPKRESLLHIAARQNSRKICVMLLDASSDLDLVEITDGRQPLHDACVHGSFDVVELLLDRRAHVDEGTHAGMRPIHWAAAAGHVDVVDLLLDRGARISATSGNTFEPLHHAASKGHDSVTRLLCKRGSNVNRKTHAGQSPLHLACHAGHAKVAAVLLDFEAMTVLEDLGDEGQLKVCRETPLEELLRRVERLRFEQDEAEDLAGRGNSDEARDFFRTVISGFREIGLINSADSVTAIASSCDVEVFD